MKSYKSTVKACYVGYFTQAIINNLAPVFFVVFQESFEITLAQISWLIFINFGVQIITDIVSVFFVDKIGYRKAIVLAHAASVIGLVFLGILPQLLPVPFVGLIIAIVIYAYGSGLIEVLVSPIIDSIPSDNKSSAMSLLHSFYCWGQLTVILLTTVALKIIGNGMWFAVPIIWAIIPLVNMFSFMRVPLAPAIPEEEKTPLRKLLGSRTFALLLVMMLCAGATEMTVSQWSSLFAEKGLGVNKVVGDLLGPCLFALFMGTGRAVYGIFGDRMNLKASLMACAVLGAVCYIVISLAPWPWLSLAACAVTGLASSLLWPGFFSLASACYPGGGTPLFSMLAVFGDLGCTFGPYIAGIVADFVQNHTDLGAYIGISAQQAGLKAGILTSVIFPIIMIIFLRQIKTKEAV